MILCVCVLVDDPSERLGELQDLSEEWNSQNIKTTSWCATIALPYHQPYDSDTETPVRLLDPPCSRLWIVPRIIIQFLSNRRHWHGMKRHNELSTVSSVTSVLFMTWYETAQWTQHCVICHQCAVYVWSLKPPMWTGFLYTVNHEKTCHDVSDYNSGFSWSIFKHFVPAETGRNSLQKNNNIYHFTLTVSPHYLVKLKPRINSTFWSQSSQFIFLFIMISYTKYIEQTSKKYI